VDYELLFTIRNKSAAGAILEIDVDFNGSDEK